MMPAARIETADVPIDALFDPQTVGSLLESAPAAPALPGAVMHDVRIERYWPTGHGGVSLEWSFQRGDADHQKLFGTWHPQRGTQIHTVQHDPRLPHLARCLDPVYMAGRLRPIRESAGRSPVPAACDVDAGRPAALECRPVGYRAGKRAAVAYRFVRRSGTTPHLLGKTYRDGRAERLLRRHASLNEQLAWWTNGAVRVPAPLAQVPEVNMALFAWAKGRAPSAARPLTPEDAAGVASALAALHTTCVDDLPSFGIADERAVLTRWQGLLCRVDRAVADNTQPLFEAIMAASEDLPERSGCTIHRDFYDRQYVQTRRTTTLLDLDTLADGDPCLDLGNWLAHMVLDAALAGCPGRRWEPIWSAALEAYEAARGPVDRRRLAFYGASAAFRVGCVHAFRSATGMAASALWKTAGEMIASTCCRTSGAAWRLPAVSAGSAGVTAS